MLFSAFDQTTKISSSAHLGEAALAADVEDLKTGTDAIEEKARGELGMIKPGETFYQVVEDDPQQKAATQ